MSFQTTAIHNLPPQSTVFVGRRSEISDIVSRFQDENCRLLTLVGSGGIGKTRLAIESIPNLIESDFEHGAFYVPLAPLTSADNIVTTIINVLGIVIKENSRPQDALVKFLSQRNLLLVMDNFEHLMEGASIIADILHATHHVKVLVTSREILNLSMEHVWHVRGMRYPETDEPDDINQFDALNLFVERAMQIRRDFSPGDEQVAIINICRLVDGLPLAIELAAGWLKTLSCADIIRQIERGIGFLKTRNRDILERHQSIRAVFNHSWNLLSDEEQRVFPRLSVFRGGFTLDAAAHVAQADVATLSGLVEKSMVRRDQSGRYDLHELLNRYADEKLHDANEITAIQSTYTRYYANLMQDLAIDIKGRRQVESLNDVNADWDNITRVWKQVINTGDDVALLNMMEALNLFVDIRAYYIEGESLFKLAVDSLKSVHTSDRMYSQLCVRYVHVWSLQVIRPIPDAIWDILNQSLALAHKTQDKMTEMLCLWITAELHRNVNEIDLCIETSQLARNLAIELGASYYEVRILRGLDYYMSRNLRHDLELGDVVRDNHSVLALQIKDYNGYAHARFNEGYRYFIQGQITQAQSILTEAAANWNLVQDVRNVAATTMTLGIMSTVLGKFDEGFQLLMKAERLLSQLNFWGNHYSVYVYASWICVIENRLTDAEGLMAKAQNYHTQGLSNRTHEIYYVQTLYAIATDNYDAMYENINATIRNLVPPYSSDMWIMIIATAPFIYSVNEHYDRAALYLGVAFGQFAHLLNWLEQWDRLTELRTNLQAELGDTLYHATLERGANSDVRMLIKQFQGYLIQIQKQQATLQSQPLIEPLTDRELEVLALLGEGQSNREIAEKLFVTIGTVKSHVHNICQKLGVKNRTQAVLEAKQLGLL